MAELRIDGDDLVLELSGKERFGAFHGDVRVPVSSVTAVRPVDSAVREVRGLRAPGTAFPRRIALGTWRRRGSKDFVATHRRGPGVVIELEGQDFGRRVGSATDIPEAVLALG